MNNKQYEILKSNFKIYDDNEYLELEAWTDGGVDMFIDIYSNKDIVEQLEEYIDNFDIDEEIEIHRECKDYKKNFTIRKSLEDFENWLKSVEDIIKRLKENENE